MMRSRPYHSGIFVRIPEKSRIPYLSRFILLLMLPKGRLASPQHLRTCRVWIAVSWTWDDRTQVLDDLHTSLHSLAVARLDCSKDAARTVAPNVSGLHVPDTRTCTVPHTCCNQQPVYVPHHRIQFPLNLHPSLDLDSDCPYHCILCRSEHISLLNIRSQGGLCEWLTNT
jgi:hypothetical protein